MRRQAKWTENKLKAKLVETARTVEPSWIWLPITERYKSGIPDLLVSGNHQTSFWELKFADPDFNSQGIQELTMRRLEIQSGRAFYVVFKDATQTIHLVKPSLLAHWENSTAAHVVSGFVFKDVIQFIKLVHTLEFFK